jgi:predicted nuclease of predicted toxin-antitoxin system
MAYRLLADENVEPSTRNYLRQLDHDVRSLADVPTLELGADDEAIAAHARELNRLILVQDADFVAEFGPAATAGILIQTDHTLTSKEVGDIVDEISQHVAQADVTVEYVSRNWL